MPSLFLLQARRQVCRLPNASKRHFLRRALRARATTAAPKPCLRFQAPSLARNLGTAASQAQPSQDPVKVIIAEEDVGGQELWRRNLVGDASLSGPRGDNWYTGPTPRNAPGFCEEDGKLRALPIPDLTTATRQDLLDYLDNNWAMTECLFAALNGEEAFYNPPKHQLRHPFIFYYGHPAVVYINKLRVAGVIESSIDVQLEQDLQTGVDEMSWDDLSDDGQRWTTVQEVKEYRQTAYNIIRKVIETHPGFEPGQITIDSPAWALVMGFEHERIHLETSSVLVREFPLRLLQQPAEWPAHHPSARRPAVAQPEAGNHYPKLEVVRVPEGEAKLGKPRDYPTFGWDNEYGNKTIQVPEFESHTHFATNGQFLEFVKDGGYREQELWSKDGWGWRTFRNAKWPCFWEPSGPHGLHQYRLRTVLHEVEMPWDWPAVINLHEARAFCNWLSRKQGLTPGAPDAWRLPTEAEHHRMRDQGTENGKDDPAFWAGETLLHGKAEYGVNGSLAHGSESPVTAQKPASTGFADTFGNVWHWCEDHFAALPNFEAHYMYDDFSVPCFDGVHNVIMGGSFISGGDLISKYARYHFRPHFFQHAGLRPTRSVAPSPGRPLKHQLSCCDSPGPHVGTEPCCVSHEAAKRAHTPMPPSAEAGAAARAVAASVSEVAHAQANVYENQRTVDAYLNLHYGYAEDVLGAAMGRVQAQEPSLCLNFPQQCARIAAQAWQQSCEKQEETKQAPTRALDLGCAVGRSSFELARTFDEVVGVDYSQAFIQAAVEMKETGKLQYWRLDEGDLSTRLTANFGSKEARDRCMFMRGDAGALPDSLGSFDVVLGANLLCRLHDPMTLLQRLPELVNPKGLVVFTNPWSWDEKHTPRQNWLGGFNELDGSQVVARKSQEALVEAMKDQGFELVSENDVPFLFREHARKFEYINTHGAVFQKV